MFYHCIYCRAPLGTNEAVESFPVGRRLAFDAAKGRLWVVCPRCAQWNLTPLEERWEAVEAAEKLFRDTRRRVQGEHIGLARLSEGLELVRIGQPQRPEFAAWRYGDRFGRRRRRALFHAATAAGGIGVVIAVGPLTGIGLAAAVTIGSTAVNIAVASRAVKANLKLPHPDGGEMLVTPNERPHVRLVERSESEGGWGLDVPYQRILRPDDPWWKRNLQLNLPGEGTARLSGRLALGAAERILPRANALGAPGRLVQDAVGLIEEAGGPERWFAAAARQTRKWGAQQNWGDTGAVSFLPRPVRLALEMAAHEESERRALEGELAELEQRWRDAEEIATIADDLLLPAGVAEMLDRLRGRRGPAGA